MQFMTRLVSTGILATLAVVGCATQTVDDDLPEVDDDGLTAQAAITVNGFTLNAQPPTAYPITLPNGTHLNHIVGKVIISGGSGTQPMGVCAVLVTNKTCSDTSVCNEYNIGSSGSKYCRPINGAGSSKCMYRFTDATQSCAGTPATGTLIGNGTYTTPFNTIWPNGNFVSLACAFACNSSAPSVSSLATYAP